MSGEHPPRSWPIGKAYAADAWTGRARDFVAYAAATDDPEAYGPTAPPMFHVRPFIGLMMGMAGDRELDIDLLRLVHGEHSVAFHRLLRDGERLTPEGRLLQVDLKATGRVYRFGIVGRVGDERILEGETSYFVRAAAPPPSGPKAPPAELPPPSWSVAQPTTADQASRYADASGDHNPIHVDERVARAAGLPGVILHGLCTMAFAARDLVAHYAPGQPERLASIGVRFAKPVLPGQTLQLQVWEQGDEVQFQTLGPDGKAVITGGRAAFRS